MHAVAEPVLLGHVCFHIVALIINSREIKKKKKSGELNYQLKEY